MIYTHVLNTPGREGARMRRCLTPQVISEKHRELQSLLAKRLRQNWPREKQSMNSEPE